MLLYLNRNDIFKFILINCLIATMQLISYGLEDDLQFEFKWPGVLFNLEDDMKQNIEMLDITTNNMEKYKCAIPVNLPEDEKSNLNKLNKDTLDVPISISTILQTNIYAKKFCSYRIESYWIYELCHGQYVKQYHETKNSGKRVVTEAYFLGYYNPDKQQALSSSSSDDPEIHWKILDGEKVATYAVKYTDGTLCEVLANTLREITIFYTCDENGNDNIATFEEVSSCMYEMIVVSKWICSHPAYKVPEKTQQTINCYSLENSPVQPEELTALQTEQNIRKNDENKLKMTSQDGTTFIIHYKTIDENSIVLNNENQQDQQEPLADNTNQIHIPTNNANDAEKQMIASFLNGHQCLTGGTGWWKYEVCLGKHVMQFHEDEQTKRRINVLLGEWNKENHLDWINRHPNKKHSLNKGERTSLSLYYSNGDKCEEKNRFAEVKFKCIKSSEKSPAISLYLLEPSTCEYLLAIESQWLCNFIEKADENNIPTSFDVETIEAKQP